MLGHTSDQMEHDDNYVAHGLFSHSQGLTGSLTYIVPTSGSLVPCPVTPGSWGSGGPSSLWVLTAAFFLVVEAWRCLLLHPQFMIQSSLLTSPHPAAPHLTDAQVCRQENSTAIPFQPRVSALSFPLSSANMGRLGGPDLGYSLRNASQIMRET